MSLDWTPPGAQVDAYEIDHTGLNQVQRVRELADGSVASTTGFTYDDNGNPLTTTHDDTYAAYAILAGHLSWIRASSVCGSWIR